MSNSRFYAYLVTDVSGSMVGKIKPGQHFLETGYKGNGSYTWTIFNWKTGEITGTVTAKYVCQVTGNDGKLDRESRRKLKAAA